MPVIYLDATADVVNMARKAFPNYTGRKFKLNNSGHPVRITSYWDGGSRNYFSAVDLTTNARVDVPQNGTPFDGGPVAPGGVAVPAGFMIAEHSIFAGKDMGITFYVDPGTSTQFLPAPVELTSDETRVLECTRSYKSSYAGIKHYRFHQSGLTRDAWDTASNSLKSKKLLNRAGAITTAGRNACPNRW